MITNIDEAGNNSLMQAFLYEPESVPAILEAMGKLNLEQQTNLLTQKNNRGWNALMIAIRHNPSSVPAILKAMDALNVKQQKNLLTQKNIGGWNALMLAICNSPNSVPAILEAMGKLNVKQQANILIPIESNSGWNTLMLAIRYSPNSVPAILKAMDALDVKKQANILIQKNYARWNSLMIAIRNNPSSVPAILKSMEKLTATQQAEILTQKLLDGWNGLMIATCYSPGSVPAILEAIISNQSMTMDTKYALIKNASPVGDFKLKNYPAAFQMCWEHEMNQLLEQLKPNQPANPNYTISLTSPKMALYKNLKSDFETYSTSKKTKQDLSVFHNAWKEKIKTARLDKNFQGTDVLEVLKNIALLISIIGIVYLAYQAGKNVEKGRSAFFPSSTELKLNRLEDKAGEAITEDPPAYELKKS